MKNYLFLALAALIGCTGSSSDESCESSPEVAETIDATTSSANMGSSSNASSSVATTGSGGGSPSSEESAVTVGSGGSTGAGGDTGTSQPSCIMKAEARSYVLTQHASANSTVQAAVFVFTGEGCHLNAVRITPCSNGHTPFGRASIQWGPNAGYYPDIPVMTYASFDEDPVDLFIDQDLPPEGLVVLVNITLASGNTDDHVLAIEEGDVFVTDGEVTGSFPLWGRVIEVE